MIDVSPHDLETIKRILAARVPDFEARAFGSRYRWTAKEYSDLDLAIVGERPVSPKEMANLRADFEESDLPFRVDVLDWQSISPEFRRVIEDGYEVLQNGGQALNTSNSQNHSTSGEWRRVPLGEVIKLQRGFDITAADRKTGSVPVISSSGVAGTHSEARVKGPGVVTGRYGTIGQVFYVEQDFWPTNTTLFVKDFKGNDPLFISYLLRTINFAQFNDKSSVPGVNRNHVHRLPVTLPPLPEQHSIAHILGTLDDKIELNRRMNETLEAIARAIFKSWFVDFDPVRAKAAGKQPIGMDAETAALFPDSFEDSELGEIPRGWRAGKVQDIATIAKQSINPLKYPNETFEHYSIPAFDEGKVPKTEAGIQIKSNKSIVSSDSILVSKLNPNTPRVWFPKVGTEYRSICSTEFFVTQPLDMISREFLYLLFSSEIFMRDFSTKVTGTSGSHQRVQPESLLETRIVIPEESIMNQFTRMARSILAHQSKSREQSHTLVTLRDILLPKLISGEVQLENTGNFVLNS